MLTKNLREIKFVMVYVLITRTHGEKIISGKYAMTVNTLRYIRYMCIGIGYRYIQIGICFPCWLVSVAVFMIAFEAYY